MVTTSRSVFNNIESLSSREDEEFSIRQPTTNHKNHKARKSNPPSAITNINTAIDIYENEYDRIQKKLEEKFKTMLDEQEETRKEIEKLKQKISNMTVEKEYIYNGKNLITEIHGKSVGRWALAAAKHIFSQQELLESVVLPSKKTDRKSLSPNRVNLLKSMYIHYN